MASESASPRRLIVSLAVVGLAFALRWLASRDDPWLDEIWTWSLVQTRVKTPLDVLLALRHENNHFLNTWWILLLGPHADFVWYRLPAVVLGSLTVLLARMAVARAGKVAVGIVTLLTLPSYLLVHYSSEARGYAYQMVFSLAAYVLLERLLRAFAANAALSRRDRWLFAATCVLGCLGHPGFLMIFLALAAWAVAAAFRTARPLRDFDRWVFGVFLVPSLLLLALWRLNLSQLENGGGPHESPWIVAASTLSLTVGGPELGTGAVLVGLAVAAAVIIELRLLQLAGDDRWICWGLMIVIPVALVAILARQEVYPRYFLGTVILLDLALAQFLARWFSRGSVERAAVCVVLGLTVLGNGLQVVRLLRDGRGRAAEVVNLLARETPDGSITIGSDGPAFRHERLLEYFGMRLGVQDRIRYLGPGPWPPEGPQWILLHDFGREWTRDEVISDPEGNTYRLRHCFPYAGLSGWQTGVYKNAGASRAPAPSGARDAR